MSYNVTITVPGLPIAQPRHKATTIGGAARMYLPGSHPVHAFKAAVALSWGPREMRTGPLHVVIDCRFPMPQTHAKKIGKKPWPAMTSRPDCDNLAKSICDALNGIAWLDDKQIVALDVRKIYAPPGHGGETEITVRELNQREVDQ